MKAAFASSSRILAKKNTGVYYVSRDFSMCILNLSDRRGFQAAKLRGCEFNSHKMHLIRNALGTLRFRPSEYLSIVSGWLLVHFLEMALSSSEGRGPFHFKNFNISTKAFFFLHWVYIDFMKSSSDDYKVDVGMSPCISYHHYYPSF